MFNPLVIGTLTSVIETFKLMAYEEYRIPEQNGQRWRQIVMVNSTPKELMKVCQREQTKVCKIETMVED